MKMFFLFLFFPPSPPMVPRILFSRMRSFTRCLLGQRLSVCACCTVSLSPSLVKRETYFIIILILFVLPTAPSFALRCATEQLSLVPYVGRLILGYGI
jgi:hypothetical protein